MICIYTLEYEISLNGSDTQSLFSVTRSPGNYLQLKDSHSKSHHKDQCGSQFPSDQLVVSCCSQKTERGGRERGGGDTAAVSLGLLDGINQFCPSASPSSSLDIRACPSGVSPFSTIFFVSDVFTSPLQPFLPGLRLPTDRSRTSFFPGLHCSANSKPDIHPLN